MDVSALDKTGVVAELKRLGMFDSNSKHELWRKAFDLHNAANPNNKIQFSMCGTCFSRVRNWLKS